MEKPRIISHNGDRIVTLDDLMELHKIDESIYELLKFKANVREGQQKDKEGNPVIIQQHQISAEFKPIRQILERKDILMETIGDKLKRKNKHKETGDNNLLGVIPKFDIHIDKYSNPVDYVDEINRKTYSVLDQLQQQGAKRLLYILGGDYFNSDGRNKTTKGTEMMNKMTEKESFKLGLKTETQLISNFADALPTDVYIFSGNHDDLRSQALADALNIFYSKDRRVYVDSENNYRKYYDWGRNTIGMGHGHGVKDKDLLSVFSMEKGLNDYNYFLRGHFHQQLKEQYGNLLVQALGTPSYPGERDTLNGYSGRGQIIGQLYDREEGKVAEFYK